MIDEVIAQVFGIFSFILGVSAFYQKDDKKLKIVMLLLNCNHLIHFLLLGSLVSAVGALLGAIRTFVAMHSRSQYIAWVFICISIVGGAFLTEQWIDWLPILGTIVGTYSIFYLSGIKLRIGFLIGACCWLSNNVAIGSIGGTLLECSVIAMNMITITRLYLDRQKQVNAI
jgi:uncharacterized membrane protein YjjB (DUF3815 family)